MGRGFTLVEILAGLIVLAVIGAIFAPFLLGTLQKTNTAAEPAQAENRLLAVMERIGDDYDQNQAYRTDLAAFRARILQDPSPYGTGFTVVQCQFIAFANGSEVAGSADDCLKVVISNGGSVLAGVFPKVASP